MDVWYRFLVEIRRYSLGLFYVLAGSLLAPSGAYLEYANSTYFRQMLRKEIVPLMIILRQP